MLTKEEKIQIIESHKKNLSYTRYNLEVSLLEENARTKVNQVAIDALQAQIQEIDEQNVVLDSEITSVRSATE
jgi:cell division protein FtsL